MMSRRRSEEDFCSTLMDIDDSFGIKASFQVIPEERYSVTAGIYQEIRQREHEIAIHDLNHDGHLYKNQSSNSSKEPRRSMHTEGNSRQEDFEPEFFIESRCGMTSLNLPTICRFQTWPTWIRSAAAAAP